MTDINIYSRFFSDKTLINREASLNFLCDSLSLCLQKTITEKDIEKDSHGKPWLKFNKSIFFSLSHSENLIALAISKERTIGFDLQIKRQVNDKIWDRITTAKEQKEISKDHFFDLWCIKEAALKFYGSGLQFPMNKIEVNWRNKSLNPLIQEFDFNYIQDLKSNFEQYKALKFSAVSATNEFQLPKNCCCYLVYA